MKAYSNFFPAQSKTERLLIDYKDVQDSNVGSFFKLTSYDSTWCSLHCSHSGLLNVFHLASLGCLWFLCLECSSLGYLHGLRFHFNQYGFCVPSSESPSPTTLSKRASVDHPVLLPRLTFFPGFDFYYLSPLPKIELLWQRRLGAYQYFLNK